jgi:hypothetical protein
MFDELYGVLSVDTGFFGLTSATNSIPETNYIPICNVRLFLPKLSVISAIPGSFTFCTGAASIENDFLYALSTLRVQGAKGSQVVTRKSGPSRGVI